MNRILYLLFFILSLNSCYQQERNCEDFHTGTFEFETFLDGELTKSTFIRTETIEIDFFKGKKDTATIRWINPCEYIIQELNPKSMAEKKAIHIKILTTEKDTYTFEYGLVGASQKQRGTAKKIE